MEGEGEQKFTNIQNAVASRIIGVERTVWFQCKVSASTLFPESFSYLPKPTRLSLEVKVVRTGTEPLRTAPKFKY